MPRFYFDLRYEDEPWSEDPEGSDIESKESARVEALELAAEIAKDQVRWHRQIAIRVRDDGPEPVVTVTLAVTMRPPDEVEA